MKTFDYKQDDLINPCLQALHDLGGSGTNAEIEEELIRILKLTEDEVEDIHRGNITKLTYRVAWARNYLKHAGLLINSSRGVWALTSRGQQTHHVDGADVRREVLAVLAKRKKTKAIDGDDGTSGDGTEQPPTWQDELLQVVKNISPDQFERLSQRLLRELGFTSVEVTGRSGDGGIDGRGILKIGGVISFSVVFQCKRYAGSVSSSTVRDFRGAVQGRADKGLLVTTGSFTRGAKVEAQRDGALAIDLLDGLELAEKLKELGLGATTETVEHVTIDEEWYQGL